MRLFPKSKFVCGVFAAHVAALLVVFVFFGYCAEKMGKPSGFCGGESLLGAYLVAGRVVGVDSVGGRISGVVQPSELLGSVGVRSLEYGVHCLFAECCASPISEHRKRGRFLCQLSRLHLARRDANAGGASLGDRLRRIGFSAGLSTLCRVRNRGSDARPSNFFGGFHGAGGGRALGVSLASLENAARERIFACRRRGRASPRRERFHCLLADGGLVDGAF